jgi:hypothetical protein
MYYLPANYSNLLGNFGTATGLPAGHQIDYNYPGQNKIALAATPALTS